jgi:hypothetical protein
MNIELLLRFPLACHGSTLAVGLRRRALGPGAGLCCAEAAAGGVVTQRYYRDTIWIDLMSIMGISYVIIYVMLYVYMYTYVYMYIYNYIYICISIIILYIYIYMHMDAINAIWMHS